MAWSALDEFYLTALYIADHLLRPTMANALVDFYQWQNQPENRRLLVALERRRLVSRTGRGRQARFTITADGRTRVEPPTPRAAWDREWDGAWRVVVFDLPESQRKHRLRLWRALRQHKLGLLQRSVWVWPHELREILTHIVQAEGVPECFCGFTARDVFLCRDAEIVRTAWDFEEITRRHRTYEQHAVARPGAVDQTVTSAALATLLRAEREAYRYAFSLDPLLPRALWPKGYRGEIVQARHAEFHRRLHRHLPALLRQR